MLAAQFYGRNDIRLDKVEEPPCSKGQIKVLIGPYRILISLNPSYETC